MLLTDCWLQLPRSLFAARPSTRIDYSVVSGFPRTVRTLCTFTGFLLPVSAVANERMNIAEEGRQGTFHLELLQIASLHGNCLRLSRGDEALGSICYAGIMLFCIPQAHLRCHHSLHTLANRDSCQSDTAGCIPLTLYKAAGEVFA